MNSSYENPENLAEPQMRRKMPPNSTSKFLKHKNIEVIYPRLIINPSVLAKWQFLVSSHDRTQ